MRCEEEEEDDFDDDDEGGRERDLVEEKEEQHTALTLKWFRFVWPVNGGDFLMSTEWQSADSSSSRLKCAPGRMSTRPL